ncbi:MAG: hypothetical protein E6Q97_37530 [Desulfurellales bacterium]|nr:MAG: hypothetical protein E6Q97_37530 [Desulfurellales bacterium]
MSVDVGVAFVGTETDVDFGGACHLENGSLAAKQLGADRIKLFLSSKYNASAANDGAYPEQVWGSTPTTLKTLAQDLDMDTLIGDFDHLLLNCWSFSGLSVAGVDPWREEDGSYNARAAIEYQEWYDLAHHLLTTFSGKNFVLSQSEGDWTMLQSTNPNGYIPPRRPEYMIGMLQARQRAVEDARRAVASTSTIKHAVEVNLLYDKRRDKHTRHMVRSVLSRIKPDVVSYSCYDSITPSADPWRADLSSMLSDISVRLNASLDLLASVAPHSEIIIGECGLPDAELPSGYLGNDIMDHIYTELSARSDVTSMYLWNLFDNEEPRGYCLIYSDGVTLSGAGTWANSFLGGSF